MTTFIPQLHNFIITLSDGTRWRTGYVYGAEGRAEYEAGLRRRVERQVEDEGDEVEDESE